MLVHFSWKGDRQCKTGWECLAPDTQGPPTVYLVTLRYENGGYVSRFLLCGPTQRYSCVLNPARGKHKCSQPPFAVALTRCTYTNTKYCTHNKLCVDLNTWAELEGKGAFVELEVTRDSGDLTDTLPRDFSTLPKPHRTAVQVGHKTARRKRQPNRFSRIHGLSPSKPKNTFPTIHTASAGAHKSQLQSNPSRNHGESIKILAVRQTPPITATRRPPLALRNLEAKIRPPTRLPKEKPHHFRTTAVRYCTIATEGSQATLSPSGRSFALLLSSKPLAGPSTLATSYVAIGAAFGPTVG